MKLLAMVGSVGAAMVLTAGAAEGPFVCGNARFTVLADRLIRMEYSPDGVFEDRPSFVFIDRTPVAAEYKVEGKGCTIDTGALKLTYLGGAFNANTLSISAPSFTWKHGAKDKGNLLGTRRTLDGVTSWKKGLSGMENGILSRDGWTVVDDTKRFLFGKSGDHWGEWVAARPEKKGYTDLYFFGYGHDYKAALRDYTRVAGKIPLPPKWSFGYWWSRYWQYSAAEIRDLVETMRSLSIPIDVMIIDMEWHDTWGIAAGAAKDCFGQSVGWTGYTWKQQLFPSPEGIMSWCEDHNLKTALNLHPASGIQPQEKCYETFAKEYGWDQPGKAIPYRPTDPKWMDVWYSKVLGSMQDYGVDFWWLDWQQWMTDKDVKGLSSTYWLNYTMWKHMEEYGKAKNVRPMIYHRWGGLGSHRYQTGFSGDTMSNWDVLAFEAWFTATSGNVGYGYWGHDLGGHASGGKPTDPELYTRWMQWGAFSPTFKTHCAKELENERRIWMHPNHFLPLREAFRTRYRYVPYIYTMARKAYDTGLSLCRPLYWDWPEEESSYAPRQIVYQFGDDLLASAVTNVIDAATGLAEMEYTLPSGKWFDMSTGAWVEGGKKQKFTYTIDEYPLWAKPGAVIPMNPDSVVNLQHADNALALYFVPGEGGETSVYEDAGESADYASAFATTRVVRKGDTVVIEPRRGTFAGAGKSRDWELRFPCRLPAKRVTVNGKDAAWTYRGADECIIVKFRGDCDKRQEIVLEGSTERVAGDIGAFRRFVRLTDEYKYSFGEMVHPWAMLPDEYLGVSETPSFLEAAVGAEGIPHPQLGAGVDSRGCGILSAPSGILAAYDAKMKTFMEELIGKRKLSGPFAKRLAAQLGLPEPAPIVKQGEYKLTKVDAKHFTIECSKDCNQDVLIPEFSGVVRVHPCDADGNPRRDVIVLTKGCPAEGAPAGHCLVFTSPYYGATKYYVELTK